MTQQALQRTVHSGDPALRVVHNAYELHQRTTQIYAASTRLYEANIVISLSTSFLRWCNMSLRIYNVSRDPVCGFCHVNKKRSPYFDTLH